MARARNRWQQAYTNLIKFIIILHKIGFGYVTLFDVYESAISSEVLERKMKEAEQNILGECFLGVSRAIFQQHAQELAAIGFEADETGQMYRATDSLQVKEALKKLVIEVAVHNERRPNGVDEDRKEQLEAVKRWYNGDWKNLDKKLQTSIIEGNPGYFALHDVRAAKWRRATVPSHQDKHRRFTQHHHSN
ncbi:MAG: hypothetical protein WCE52_14020 [Candidatus Acidiferrum sp.]